MLQSLCFLHWKIIEVNVSKVLTTAITSPSLSFNFLLASAQKGHHEQSLWQLFPPAASISGIAAALSLVFSFCHTALSYRSSLVTFPETTLTPASSSPTHSDLLKASMATHQFTGTVRSQATYRSWAIIRISQPLKCCEYHERAAAA